LKVECVEELMLTTFQKAARLEPKQQFHVVH
jgi:hypothetical protein